MHNISNGDILHVYYIDTDDYIGTNELLDKVPDAEYTGEVWVTKPITVNYLKRIRVTIPRIKGEGYDRPLKYNYGGKNDAELWFWDYDNMDTPILKP